MTYLPRLFLVFFLSDPNHTLVTIDIHKNETMTVLLRASLSLCRLLDGIMVANHLVGSNEWSLLRD
jgi:hypothetical protein